MIQKKYHSKLVKFLTDSLEMVRSKIVCLINVGDGYSFRDRNGSFGYNYKVRKRKDKKDQYDALIIFFVLNISKKKNQLNKKMFTHSGIL